jgi:hypothetical protein
MVVAEATSPEEQAKRLELFEKVRKVKTIGEAGFVAWRAMECC